MFSQTNEIQSSSRYVRTFKVDYDWLPSTNAADSGFTIVPGVPYQIVYDPPGDMSSASLTNSSAVQTSVTTSFGVNAGASLSFGYEWEAPFGISSGDISVTASVKYAHNKDNNFTATIANSQTLSTSALADASIVGPGRGDLFVCPSLKIKWHLYRALADVGDSCAYKDGYVYKLFYTPVEDPQNTQLMVTASQLKDMVKDTAALRKILATSAVDPATHRIRSSLLDGDGNPIGSRLAAVDQTALLLAGGGAALARSYDSTVSQQVTVTSDLDVGMEAAAKVSAGGVYIATKLSVDVTVGSANSGTQSFSRSISQTLQDANSWDVIRYRTYLDRAFGVYVYQVDSAQSWTSFPYEAGYSKPSVAMKVSSDHDTLFVEKGALASFKLSVRNANRVDASMLDTIKDIAVSAIKTSGTDVSIDPVEVTAPRDSIRLVNVTVSAPDTGTYPLEIKLSGTLGQGTSSEQTIPVTQTIPLVVKVGSTSTGIATARLSQTASLMNLGRQLRIVSPNGSAWTLQTRDLGGRLLQTRTGTGTQNIDLPSSQGILLQTLDIGGTQIRALSSSLR